VASHGRNIHGSGKSAIGQVIHRNGNDLEPFANCPLIHQGDAKSYLHLVYNEDFVEKNFRSQMGFPGIFSIGQQDAEALKEAEQKQKDADALALRLDGLIAQKAEREAEAAAALRDTSSETWKIWTDHDGGALEACARGYGNNKKNLLEKLLGVVLAEGVVPQSIEQLTVRIKDVDEGHASEKAHVAIDLSGLDEIEKAAIWGEPIVGSSNSSLASLIQQLGNMDWVKQGEGYLSKEVCPFCQQGLPHNFKDELAKLMDENYKKRVGEVASLYNRYTKTVAGMATAFQSLLGKEEFAKENPNLQPAWDKFEHVLEATAAQMRGKVFVPSEAVQIWPSKEGDQADL
jgi:wobble nucleotide-excising tRNase